MDLTGFQMALGDLPVDMAGSPADALVDLWNKYMTQEIDTFTPSALSQV